MKKRAFYNDRMYEVAYENMVNDELTLFDGHNIMPRCNSTKVILMQTTNCFDKENKEIFEGDIIEDINSNSNQRFVVVNNNGFIRRTIQEFNKKTGGFALLPKDCLNFKVMGNIYENSDLLK